MIILIKINVPICTHTHSHTQSHTHNTHKRAYVFVCNCMFRETYTICAALNIEYLCVHISKQEYHNYCLRIKDMKNRSNC